ncbi:MAG: hypothetical protein HY751_09230 [Nitrospinae bacterium]|nr:hypothetical protein [Nitrospinota bacterium]
MAGSKERYLKDIRSWAMYMLEILRPLPNTAEKHGILQQVDKLKDVPNLLERDVPAYAGAIAVLTAKAVQLVRGTKLDTMYHKEKIMELLNSSLLKKHLTQNPVVMIQLKELLDISPKSTTSMTLEMLSKSGH